MARQRVFDVMGPNHYYMYQAGLTLRVYDAMNPVWLLLFVRRSEHRTCLFDPSKYIVDIDIAYKSHYAHNYSKYGSGRLPIRQQILLACIFLVCRKVFIKI